MIRSRPCATAPSWPPCSTTGCAGMNFAASESATWNCGKASCTSVFWARATKQPPRHVVAHPRAISLINEYLNRSGHVFEDKGAMFRPIRNTRTRDLEQAISPDAIYKLVTGYGKKEGVYFKGMRPHSLRATAATNALLHDSDIAKVQDWLGHASISTTRLYDKRSIRPGHPPPFG